MVPPPPKLGQRDLFNDSFFSFLRRKDKSQPAPPVLPQSPDSQAPAQITNGHGHARDEGLGEKKALLQDGHRLLDSTKDLLEQSHGLLRKDTIKRFRKQAAKLTKGAPSKSKLPKKSVDEVSAFQENARVLFQEVENIFREFEPPPNLYSEQQPLPQEMVRRDTGRSRSESPPPLPKKAPSPRVQFDRNLQPDPNAVNLSRHQSVRRGYELSDPPRDAGPKRQESVKPPSSSRHRENEAEVTRGSSQRVPDQSRSKNYEKEERREDDRYRYRDDPKRSQTTRYTSDRYRDRERGDPYNERGSHSRHYSDTRDYNKDYYDSRSRRYDDRGKDRDRDRRRDDRDRDRDRDRDARKGESSRAEPAMRVVHEDAPLSAAHGGSGGVPFVPTHIDYPDESGKRRRDKEKEREKEYRDRDRDYRDRDKDRDRERDKGDRDRDRDRDRRRGDDYERSHSKRDDDYYKSRGSDKYKTSSSRRYEDDPYKSSSGRQRGYDERDKYRDREKYRERDRDRERDRGGDRERDREKERRQHAGDTPPSPTDPTASKFQEVFSPPEQPGGVALPPPSEHAG